MDRFAPEVIKRSRCSFSNVLFLAQTRTCTLGGQRLLSAPVCALGWTGELIINSLQRFNASPLTS